MFSSQFRSSLYVISQGTKERRQLSHSLSACQALFRRCRARTSRASLDSPSGGWQNAASSNAPVAQLDRAFDYESKGRTFESCRAHQLNQRLRGTQKVPLSFCSHIRSHIQCQRAWSLSTWFARQDARIVPLVSEQKGIVYQHREYSDLGTEKKNTW